MVRHFAFFPQKIRRAAFDLMRRGDSRSRSTAPRVAILQEDRRMPSAEDLWTAGARRAPDLKKCGILPADRAMRSCRKWEHAACSKKSLPRLFPSSVLRRLAPQQAGNLSPRTAGRMAVPTQRSRPLSRVCHLPMPIRMCWNACVSPQGKGVFPLLHRLATTGRQDEICNAAPLLKTGRHWKNKYQFRGTCFKSTGHIATN